MQIVYCDVIPAVCPFRR